MNGHISGVYSSEYGNAIAWNGKIAYDLDSQEEVPVDVIRWDQYVRPLEDGDELNMEETRNSDDQFDVVAKKLSIRLGELEKRGITPEEFGGMDNRERYRADPEAARLAFDLDRLSAK